MTDTATHSTRSRQAYRWVLSGQVQGVGFRPFVYRLAHKYGLSGSIKNFVGLVEIRAHGQPEALDAFQNELLKHAPPLARPHVECRTSITPDNQTQFIIEGSEHEGQVDVYVPADQFTCDDCLCELNEPKDRRYRYPFINCTQCGPRYTLIKSMPYDRSNTTMAGFTFCSQCLEEYENPTNRRFHAESVACPKCGPTLSFHSKAGQPIEGNEAALIACIESLKQGRTVAVKGVGGYHLMCDAGNDSAVESLRTKKARPHKPLAVMFPAPIDDPLQVVNRFVKLMPGQASFLSSSTRPIVLATKKDNAELSKHISPGLNELGVMLPYSPLHHLLLNGFAGALVATSANISGEPVLTDSKEIVHRLAHVADDYLQHDRHIQRPADDSVYRFIFSKPRPIRIGRGHAPLELALPFKLNRPVLAVGGQMKNTVALAWDERVVISPHIGDMENARSLDIFEQTVMDLQALYRIEAEQILCDAHPSYTTTRWANKTGLPVQKIFHHFAHASATFGNEAVEESWIAFTWDGVGYGQDGTLWGGEALIGTPGGWQRAATMRPFRPPGGDRVGREPWRSAAALCWEIGRDYPASTDAHLLSLLYKAWRQKINSPATTAVGRLFDVAAALSGICITASYEGQGSMLLEVAYEKAKSPIHLPLERNKQGLWETDWEPLFAHLLNIDYSQRDYASIFHSSMAQVIYQQASKLREEHGVTNVLFAGGVFQNRVLTELAVDLLELDGFKVKLSMDIPVNDGGLSYGQIIEYGSLINI